MTELDAPDGRIENYIYRHIGKKSAREMATDLGVQPDEILRVKREMVDSVDELTMQVQKTKLLRSLQQIADDAQKAADEVDDERNKAGLYNSSIAAMKALFTELNRLSKSDQEKIDQLNELRKREIVNLYIATVDTSVNQIAEEFDIDATRLFEILNANLEKAAAEMDNR